MARSREEIISEMVDSGLFTDDEIREAVKGVPTTESPKEEKSLGKKAWDALAVPYQKSREGLDLLADMVPKPEPKGNMPIDVLKGAPRVIADTVAEVAPTFIDRTAIVTAGALKGAGALRKPFAAVGRGLGKAGESVSGLEYKTPGVLKEAFHDRKLIAAPGTKKAGALYEKTDDAIRQELKEIPDNLKQVEKAMEWFKDGSLTPKEALEARKSLDASRKKVTGTYYRWARESLDKIAKQETKMADAAYARGVKADALRQPLPQNKLGGTSIAKSTLGTLAGLFPMLAMSPLFQATIATGAGMAARGLRPLIANAGRVGSATGAANTSIEKLYELIRGRER